MKTYNEATAEDLGRVSELYIEGLKETGADNIDPERARRHVVACFLLAPCFVMRDYDKIVGIAGLTTKNASWSGVTTLCDYMFYILPEYRGLKSLGGLVEKCKEFSREQRMPLRLEFISQNDEELRKRVFEMHGFKPVSVVGEYNG